MLKHSAKAGLLMLVLALFSLGCGSSSSSDGDEAEGAEAAATDTTSTSVTESTQPETSQSDNDGLFPDVVGVDAALDDDGTWTFNVTLSSPYDSPARYADAWRVVGADGEVFGERILAHDHAGEQPFTRSQSGIAIPDDVTEVIVEGRDQVNGWGGQSMTYALTR